MVEDFGNRLSLVTILRDEAPDDAHHAKEAGKITWDICWDGSPGDICTRWAVDGFPEIYVIDPHGRVAAFGPRDKQLRWKVEQLLATSQ